MSFKPSGWMWVLFAAASLLVLAIVSLLRQGAESGAQDSRAVPAPSGLRKPFPAGGELEGIQRPNTLQPRKKSAPDPQFQRPEQK
jgi:hypothetical protein